MPGVLYSTVCALVLTYNNKEAAKEPGVNVVADGNDGNNVCVCDRH